VALVQSLALELPHDLGVAKGKKKKKKKKVKAEDEGRCYFQKDTIEGE